jgi:hypothetical protein
MDILHFPARVLVIQAARGCSGLVTDSDFNPGHGSARLLVRRAVPGSSTSPQPYGVASRGPNGVRTPWSRGRVD